MSTDGSPPIPPPKPPAPPSWASPLGIIALFLTVTEAVTGLAVTQAKGEIQLALTIYVIVLPLLVLFLFGAILWSRPYVLYPPSEYTGGATIKDFVDAMQAKYSSVLARREADESQIQAIVKDAVKSSVMTESLAVGNEPSKATEATRLGDLVMARIDEQVLTIETAPLSGPAKVRKIPFDQNLTVQDFLDDVYFSIADRVKPFSYGTDWVLRDGRTGQVFRVIGRPWALVQGVASDNRKLAEVGIAPGMRLQTIRPPASL